MKFIGKVQNIASDWDTGQMHITFSTSADSVIKELDEIRKLDKLDIEVEKHKDKRSLDANGLLWVCLGKIASSMTPPADKWDIYLQMLKRYGKYTYICVKPNVVDAMKAQWRECEMIGEIDINGQKAIQMLCYFGSSTYNTKEFSVLLDGVISEMSEMNIPTPTSKAMRLALEKWEKEHGKEKEKKTN